MPQETPSRTKRFAFTYSYEQSSAIEDEALNGVRAHMIYSFYRRNLHHHLLRPPRDQRRRTMLWRAHVHKLLLLDRIRNKPKNCWTGWLAKKKAKEGMNLAIVCERASCKESIKKQFILFLTSCFLPLNHNASNSLSLGHHHQELMLARSFH